jgi:hypothetical protein
MKRETSRRSHENYSFQPLIVDAVELGSFHSNVNARNNELSPTFVFMHCVKSLVKSSQNSLRECLGDFFFYFYFVAYNIVANKYEI